jgi:hypothetical protein
MWRFAAANGALNRIHEALGIPRGMEIAMTL